MCQAVVPDLFHDSEQRVLPSVHQRGRHHQHHASHMTKSHDTHAHDWLKGKWRRSHGKYKKIKCQEKKRSRTYVLNEFIEEGWKDSQLKP